MEAKYFIDVTKTPIVKVKETDIATTGIIEVQVGLPVIIEDEMVKMLRHLHSNLLHIFQGTTLDEQSKKEITDYTQAFLETKYKKDGNKD